MLGDFSLSLDFLAALCTLLYVARLLVFGQVFGDSRSVSFCSDARKKSLLNQQIRPRVA